MKIYSFVSSRMRHKLIFFKCPRISIMNLHQSGSNSRLFLFGSRHFVNLNWEITWTFYNNWLFGISFCICSIVDWSIFIRFRIVCNCCSVLILRFISSSSCFSSICLWIRWFFFSRCFFWLIRVKLFIFLEFIFIIIVKITFNFQIFAWFLLIFF